MKSWSKERSQDHRKRNARQGGNKRNHHRETRVQQRGKSVHNSSKQEEWGILQQNNAMRNQEQQDANRKQTSWRCEWELMQELIYPFVSWEFLAHAPNQWLHMIAVNTRESDRPARPRKMKDQHSKTTATRTQTNETKTGTKIKAPRKASTGKKKIRHRAQETAWIAWIGTRQQRENSDKTWKWANYKQCYEPHTEFLWFSNPSQSALLQAAALLPTPAEQEDCSETSKVNKTINGWTWTHGEDNKYREKFTNKQMQERRTQDESRISCRNEERHEETAKTSAQTSEMKIEHKRQNRIRTVMKNTAVFVYQFSFVFLAELCPVFLNNFNDHISARIRNNERKRPKAKAMTNTSRFMKMPQTCHSRE